MNGQTLAGIFGSIIATIATVLALVFGFSPVATHSIQPGSVNPEPTPTTVEDGVIPSHAVKADAQKAEEILRRGVRGIESPSSTSPSATLIRTRSWPDFLSQWEVPTDVMVSAAVDVSMPKGLWRRPTTGGGQ